MPRDVAVSKISRDYILRLAEDGARLDGRKVDEYRPVAVKVGVIGKADGSCEVRMGNTRVLTGVKLKVATPYPDSPDKGVMTTSAEMNPLAAPNFEAGPPRPEGIELARVVDRGIRESDVIKFDKLCIEEGEKVWMVFLDLHMLDYDGNLFDACSLSALGAILTATMPNVQYGVAKKDTPLPTSEPPISCTSVKIGKAILSDPGLLEEQVLDTRLTVAFDSKGAVRAMQKGGNGSWTVEELSNTMDVSDENAKKLRALLQKAVKDGSASSAAK